MRELEANQRVAFARAFREARAAALRDAEAFEEHLFVLERLGTYISNSNGGLAEFAGLLEQIARESPLAFDAAREYPEQHLGFSALYEEARIARNDAMHQGAVARHLARNAQELALIMEDALMNTATTAKDFMVRGPVCAELWQPLSAIRRTMLVNAFSFLPFEKNKEWRFISDGNLVTFVRSPNANRKKRMLLTLEEALAEGLQSTPAEQCGLNNSIEKLAQLMRNVPWLIFSDRRLVGLITAFDLL